MKNNKIAKTALDNFTRNEKEALADVLRLTFARHEPGFVGTAKDVLMKWAERVDERTKAREGLQLSEKEWEVVLALRNADVESMFLAMAYLFTTRGA